MNFSSLIPCLIDHLFLVSDFRQLPCQNCLEFFPSFLHCRPCIRFLKCLRHRNEFVHKTIMSYRIRPFCSNVILMRFVSSSFQPWSRAFVGIDNTSVFCLAFPNIAVGFFTALYRYFCKALLRASEFPTFSQRLEFFVVWLNEEYSSRLSGIVDISIAHLCCAFFFFAASDINFHISGHTLSGLEVVCFLASLHPDQVYPSGGLSFNKINLVKPVYASDNSFSPSTFQ